MDVDAPTNQVNGDLSSLSEPLRGFAMAAFSPDDINDESTSKRLDDLEVALRSHALSLVEELTLHPDGTPEHTVALEQLLSYLKEVTLFTVNSVQSATSTDTTKSIAANPLFHKLPTLLLSDITSTLPISTIQTLWSSTPSSPFHPSGWSSMLCHPSIFKQSSKMLLLKICNSLLKQCSNRDVDAEFAGSIMTTLSVVFPLSERSAMNVLGSFNVENCTRYEELEEFERGLELRGADTTTNVEKKDTVNSLGYGFYSTFWGVQNVFTDPPGTILADKGGFGAFESFVKDIQTILAAFESTPAIASSSSKSAEVPHYKYLTSSQLLHLQLKDPEIRTHFLTQLIILLNHLNSSSATLPTPSLSATPGSNPAKLNAQLKQTQSTQLAELEKRTQQLLKSIKPGGDAHLRALCWILKERESMWRNWKKNKCAPPLEKVDESKVSFAEFKKVLSGKRRKIGSADYVTGSIDIKDDLPGVLTDMKSKVSSLEVFLEPYVEACDPEAEVDAEYHPANDSVYCWRGLRLMARSQDGEGQLRRFGSLRRRDGNFEGIVRDMYKVDKGNDIPGTYVDVEDDEAPFRPKHAEKAAAVDAEMEDAASVGTPEADEDAKKEKMAEFEKAAMEMDEELFSEHEDGDAGEVQEKADDKAHDASTGSKANGTNGDTSDAGKKDDAKPKEDGTTKEEDGAKANDDDKPPQKPEVKESDKSKIQEAEDKLTSKPEEDAKNNKPQVAVKSEDTDANKKEGIATKSEDINPGKKEEATTKSVAESTSQTPAKKSAGKDVKPTVHSARRAPKFTPKEQIRQKQHTKEQSNKAQTQQQQQDQPKDKQQSGSGAGQIRDAGGNQDRRGSDSRRGPPHQQHQGRGGRFGNREDRHHHMDGPPQGRGRGWQPPQGRGRDGRDGNRGPDRRGRGGRR